jgi:RAMP superfamily protein
MRGVRRRKDRRQARPKGLTGEDAMAVHTPFRFAPIHRWVYFPAWGELATHDVPFADGLCGEITVEIEAKTPLLIGGGRRKGRARDELSQEDQERWPEGREGEVRPFRIRRRNGTVSYGIPGSSLQGMVRSILEIVTFARLGPRIAERRFGIRDLLRPAEPFYQRRLADSSRPNGDNGPQHIKSNVQAGWLRKVGDCFELKRCSFARLEYNDLVEITGVRAGPVPLRPRRGDFSNPGEYRRAQTRYRECRAWEKKSDVEERYGWVAAERLRTPLWVDEKEPDDGYSHRIGTSNPLRIFYRKAHRTGGDGKCQVDNGRIVLTGNPSDPPSNASDPKKHLEFYFFNAQPGEELKDFQPKFDEFLSIHQPGDGPSINPNWQYFREDGYPREGPFEDGGWMPIFYLPDEAGGVDSFGLAYMFKMAHAKTTHELLMNSSPDHADETDPEKPTSDFASLIFGSVADKDGRLGMKRRASFDTAIATLPDPACPDDQQILSADNPTVLLAPKPSYYPIYVRQPRGSQPDHLPDNLPYATFTPILSSRQYEDFDALRAEHRAPELSGVKIWPAESGEQACQFPNFAPLPNEIARNKRVQVKLHALPAKTVFSTKLRIHNLRSIELGAVLWTLTFGERGKLEKQWGKLVHRIGMAKAYQLGQIKVRITGVSLIPNNSGANQPMRGVVGETSELRRALDQFEEHIRIEYKEGAGGVWDDSAQVKSVLKAADPAQNGDGSLKYMPLGRRGMPNSYINEKNASRFLSPYLLDGHEAPRPATDILPDLNSRDYETPLGDGAAGPFSAGRRVRDIGGEYGAGVIVKSVDAGNCVTVKFDRKTVRLPIDELDPLP